MTTRFSRPLALLCGSLLALGACNDSRRGGPPPAPSRIPAFDVQVQADRYTGTAGTTFQLAASSQTGRAPVRYEWRLADGTTASGDTVSLTLGQVGSFVSTVVATDASGRSAATQVLSTVFPAAGATTTGLLGVARAELAGDVDGSGSLTLQDALRLARLAARTDPAAGGAEVLRADATLDGRITAADVDHVAGALDGAAPLPSSLLPARGAAGCIVRVTAPLLLDPAANVTVRVGDGPEVLLDRVELGRGSFVVPFTTSVGRTEVVLTAGANTTSLDFEVLPAYAPTAAPGALFARLTALEDVARPLARDGLVAYLDATVPAVRDRQTLLALWDAAQARIQAQRTEVQEVMATLPPDVVALLEQVAVANGMLEQIAEGEQIGGAVAAAGTSALLLGDTALTALCWLSAYKNSVVATGAGWLSAGCEYGATAAAVVLAVVGLGLAPTGFVPAGALAALATILSVCSAAAGPLAVAEVVAEYAPDLRQAQLRLVADPAVLQPPAVTQSQLRVSLTVPLDPQLRALGGALVDKIVEKAVARVFAKSPLIRSVTALLQALPENVREQLLADLEAQVATAVGEAVDAAGIGAQLDALSAYVSSLASAYGATIDPNGVLGGPVPDIGTLQLAPPGTEQPSIYTGDSSQPATVTFTASKSICGMALTATAQVSYGLRPVTITMGDNGSLLDDIYAVEVEGNTVLTSSVPVVQTSTVVELTVGDHVVVMRGLAAPDGIGTYYIQFGGASVLPGSSATSGSDLVPGTFKTFNIRVQ